MKTIASSILLLAILVSCSPSKKLAGENNAFLLEDLMKTKPRQFSYYIKNKDSLRLQIIYTKIVHTKNGQSSFHEYRFNVNDSLYFYPASTVKMPAAFLALEKLNELNNPTINKYTTVKTRTYITSPATDTNTSTIANYIKQVFLVSDNDAFNHLYEFLGQGYIQQKLKEKGYTDAEIRHHLQIFLTPEQNRETDTVSFYDASGNLTYQQLPQYNSHNFTERKSLVGIGYYKDTQLIRQPFDFSLKNRIYLEDLHHILQSVLFPESVTPLQRFNLTDDDYRFLYKWMSSYPHESKSPKYDSAKYWDAYAKFLFYGEEKSPVNKNIRIFNKVGDAYGFLTDVAYVIDKENNIEFMLGATLLCNEKRIFNNDDYQYETIGLPFLKNLGELIYHYELKSNRFKNRIIPPKFLIDYGE